MLDCEPLLQHSPSRLRVILAATDLGEGSAAAVRRAAQLCSINQARMHLVHVQRAGGAASRVREAAARVAAEYGVPVEAHVGAGGAAGGIAERAHSVGADLVVVGNAPKGFLGEVLKTGMALQVQRRAGLPVLAVSHALSRPYACILVPTDLSPGAAAAAQQARGLFPGATLILLYAHEAASLKLLGWRDVSEDVARDVRRLALLEGMDRLYLFAREASLEKVAALRVSLDDLALSTQREAAQLDADLIVLRPGRGWLARGAAGRVVAQPPCDLLLMP